MSRAESALGFSHAFPNGIVTIVGQLELETTPRGVRPTRLPVWTRGQHHDLFMRWDADATAGVRLTFSTAARRISLEVLCTRIQIGDASFPAVFELVIDGEVVERARASEGDLLELGEGPTTLSSGGSSELIEFVGLPAGEKTVTVWLPHSAGCELISLSSDAPITAPPPSSDVPTWLHHGSSISHCLEVENPRDTWPAIGARLAGVESVNLGFAGNALIEPFVARSIRDAHADIISLGLGINVALGDVMSPRIFYSAVHGFLDTIRDGHPTNPIVLISPIASPRLESAAGLLEYTGGATGLAIGLEREHLAAIVAERADANLHYLDGRALLSLHSANDIPDGVHPNAAGYRLMGERFAPTLRAIISSGAQTG